MSVRLTDDGVHRPQPLPARSVEHVGDDRVGGPEGRQCRRQHDRSLDLAELDDLSGTHELSVTVADVQPRGQRSAGESLVRHHGRYSGVDVATGDGDLTDPDTRDVRDRVERADR
jgi:hypothetical protein